LPALDIDPGYKSSRKEMGGFFAREEQHKEKTL